MMKARKTIAAFGALMLLASFAACGNGGTSTGGDVAAEAGQPATAQEQQQPAQGQATQEETPQPAPQPADLTGTWKQTNPNGDAYMEATIGDGTIEVDWVGLTGSGEKALYWKGTYEAPTQAGDWKWTSQGDTEAMSSALLASQDATKEFTYTEADGVSWQTTVSGATVTVKTSKQ